MLEYFYHPDFEKEAARLKRRFVHIMKAIEDFKRLCEVQFHPLNPKQIISLGKLHRISQNAIWSLWKVELVIPNSGLRPNQFPRLWFTVKGEEIAFLAIAAHSDNYNNNEFDRIALLRINDIF